MMILIGSLGIAAVFFYILYHIIKFIIQYKKKKGRETYNYFCKKILIYY
jgi:hypothetical protein